jgi:4-amino-4-deoxy-L-arabinose transferase-like glycosyltransferase
MPLEILAAAKESAMKLRRVVVLSLIGLFLSTVLILAGVFILKRGGTVWGLVLVVAAIVLFATSIVLTETFPPTEEEATAYKPYIIPALFGILSLGLVFLSLYIMGDWQRPAAMNWLMAAAWVGSMLSAAIGILWAVRWPPPRRSATKEWFRQNRQELLILTGILLLGLFLRLYLLQQHPFPWSGDEASVGTEARRIIQGEVTDLFDAGWSGQPNWSFVPTVFSEVVFGQTFFAIRMVSALEGTLAILFAFLLARELFNKKVALMAAAFLAAFPYHLQFSRIGVNNVVDSLMVCLILWLVLRAIRKGGLEDYVIAGLATGLTFYTYVGSRLVLGLAILVFAYAAIRRKGFLKSHLLHLGFFVLGSAIAIAPLAFYFIRHPDIFMTRLGQESIFINHWLTLQAERSGQSVAYLLWRQFTDTVLVYISQPALGNFFNSPNPYLTVLGSFFFLFGLAYAFLRFTRLEMIALQAWFWSVVFLGGVLTTSPPANTRLIMTAPAVAILLALGIEQFMGILARIRIVNTTWQAALSILVLVILGFQNIFFYFGVYRTANYFEDATGELTQFVGLELQKLGPDYDYYLFGLPRVFAAFPTVVFLAPKSGMYDVTGDSIDSMVVPPGRGALIVAIPENLTTLQLVAQRFPGGTWEEVPRVYKVETLYYAYILPPSAVP